MRNAFRSFFPLHALRATAAFAACRLLSDGAATAQERAPGDYTVRIALARGVERVAVAGTAACRILDDAGRTVARLAPGESLIAHVADGRAGGLRFRLVIGQFDPRDEVGALTVARRAQLEYRLETRVYRLPAEGARGRARLIVTVGEFDSLDAARAYQANLPNERIDAIYEERTRAASGQVVLRRGGGDEVLSGARQFTVAPDDPTFGSIFVREVEAGDDARNYRGRIAIAVDERGRLTVVNQVGLEDYLYGVVAAEIGNFAPAEALRAQAVVARSETVAKLERGIVAPSELYDFDDTAMDQAYEGIARENDAVRDAVDATRGEILVYDGRAVDAVYSHSCGGVIAAAHDIWGGPPLGYSRRLADRLMEREVADLSSREAAVAWTTRPVEAFCNPEQEGFPNYAKAHFRWERTFEAETLDALMDRRFETGAVERVTVEARSPSGRVRRLAIVGEKRTVRLERELEIRAALGDLKSNFFTLTTERDERGALRRLKVNGAGFGHGVGLCQMGAFMMARQGYNHRQILGFYFAEVSVRRLYGP